MKKKARRNCFAKKGAVEPREGGRPKTQEKKASTQKDQPGEMGCSLIKEERREWIFYEKERGVYPLLRGAQMF